MPAQLPDVLAQLRIHNQEVTLICEVKEPAYPRQIRQAIDTLSAYITKRDGKGFQRTWFRS